MWKWNLDWLDSWCKSGILTAFTLKPQFHYNPIKASNDTWEHQTVTICMKPGEGKEHAAQKTKQLYILYKKLCSTSLSSQQGRHHWTWWHSFHSTCPVFGGWRTQIWLHEMKVDEKLWSISIGRTSGGVWIHRGRSSLSSDCSAQETDGGSRRGRNKRRRRQKRRSIKGINSKHTQINIW